jgi:hypothetical protein
MPGDKSNTPRNFLIALGSLVHKLKSAVLLGLIQKTIFHDSILSVTCCYFNVHVGVALTPGKVVFSFVKKQIPLAKTVFTWMTQLQCR